MKIKTILISLFIFLANTSFAHALSWSLKPNTSSDKIIISNNAKNEKLETIRTDKNKILIQSKNFDLNPQLVSGKLVENIIPTEYGLTIQLKSNAFGFIQNQDKNGNLTLEIYSDPLGSRWKPTEQRKELNKEVSQKEEKVKVKLEELKQSQIAQQQQQKIKPQETATNTKEPVENKSQAPVNNNEPVENDIPLNDDVFDAYLASVQRQNKPEEFLKTAQASQANLEKSRQDMLEQQKIAQQIQEYLDKNQIAIDPTQTRLVADNTPLTKETPVENKNLEKTDDKPFDPKTFTPPSVTFKLNSNKPDDSSKISQDDIQRQIDEQNNISPNIEKEAISIVQNIPEELPLVIEDDRFKTPMPTTPQEAGLVEPEPKAPDPEAPPMGEIIYVDEQGNKVPAPIDIPAAIQIMRKAHNLGVYETVFEQTERLKNLNLPKELLEEIYYNRAKSFFVINSRNLKETGEKFITIGQEALNISPNSTRRPNVIANLAVTYLALDRPQEARAYTDILFKSYPHNADTPNAMLLLSDYYIKHGEYALASQYLQNLIDNYPDNSYAKDAALLQIKALYKLGNYEKTLAMIEFTDRRWPKVYLESSDYLMIKAHLQENRKDLPGAIDSYWKIFNLDPKSESAPDVLFKIANLYYDTSDKDSAKKVLEQLYKDYPKSPQSPKALLYIAENGRNDDNLTLDETFNIFKHKNPVYPATYYEKIIEEYPDSHEAILAKLRLAVQNYLEKDYLKAAQLAQDVFQQNVDKNESTNASELLYRAFSPMLDLALNEQNFERVLQLWEEFPAVRQYYEPIKTDLRMAMARAYLNRDNVPEAEKLLSIFLDKVPSNEQEYNDSIYAYDVFLAHAINKQDWQKVLDLNEKTKNWQLPKEKQLNKIYTTALAAENLGLDARALPLWESLASTEGVPLYQRAYAQYFLARDAEKKQNLRGAYQANLDTLAMFEDLRNMQSPYASQERERESIAALMDITEIAGRYTESMQWLNRYRNYVPNTSPDYAGLQLREARLHRKMGDTTRWRSILEEVKQREPDSVYGKMASSELNTFEMARDLNRFTGN